MKRKTLNLYKADAAVRALKIELEIPPELPHKVDAYLWNHEGSDIEWSVSIFTKSHDVEIGYGKTLEDALTDVQAKIVALRPWLTAKAT